MKTIGLFEAKTKLSEICDTIARTGQPVIVNRRGKPLVGISPAVVRSRKKSVCDLRDEFIRKHGPLDMDFEIPPRRIFRRKNLLDG